MELVIVVMVMSILATVATPKFLDSMVYHRVESAAMRLKCDLELARHIARMTSTTQSITFTNASYTISGTGGLDQASSTYFVDFAAAPYELDAVTPNFNNVTSVSFDGYGKPARGGTVVLRANKHQCTLTLDATTGEVTVARTTFNTVPSSN